MSGSHRLNHVNGLARVPCPVIPVQVSSNAIKRESVSEKIIARFCPPKKLQCSRTIFHESQDYQNLDVLSVPAKDWVCSKEKLQKERNDCIVTLSLSCSTTTAFEEEERQLPSRWNLPSERGRKGGEQNQEPIQGHSSM